MSYSCREEPKPDSLLTRYGYKPSDLFFGETLYEDLAREGIQSFCLLEAKHIGTTFTGQNHRGSEIIGYGNFNDLVKEIGRRINQEDPMYFYVHFGSVDKAGHDYGPGSPEHRRAISQVAAAIGRLAETLHELIKHEAVMFITADHGMAPFTEAGTVYLDEYPEVAGSLRDRSKGGLILPTGGPDDVILFLRPEAKERTISFLRHNFADRALIIEPAEAIKQGYFGIGKPSPEFVELLGDVLIFAKPGHHFWWHFDGKPFGQKGVHGGLSRSVMKVPWFILSPENLQRS